jgi:hypothetical protein
VFSIVSLGRRTRRDLLSIPSPGPVLSSTTKGQSVIVRTCLVVCSLYVTVTTSSKVVIFEENPAYSVDFQGVTVQRVTGQCSIGV